MLWNIAVFLILSLIIVCCIFGISLVSITGYRAIKNELQEMKEENRMNKMCK